jgi:LmbE family N-acetylglucosaminyl deacetylase
MNVLAIGAHFDDIELGCAGALAQHVKNGDSVYIYVATDSQYSNPVGTLMRSDSEAAENGETAAKIIGGTLYKGRCKSLLLEFNEELNSQLIQIIEEKRINLIYTHWTDDIQHDHINLAKASIHAGRHVPRILSYRSNWYISDMPFHENFYVDISDTWEIKEQAILSYKSEMKRVGTKWIDYFRREAENNGLKMGVKYAEGFRLVKWLL